VSRHLSQDTDVSLASIHKRAYQKLPSGDVSEDFEILAAHKPLLVWRGAIDLDHVDIFEGRKLFIDCPGGLFTSNADALSLIEGHGPMLGVGEDT
jgi:hypothetical protein